MKNQIFKTTLILAVISVFFSSCSSTKKDVAEDKPVFNNPIALQRADPWIYKDTDGTYYFIATAPEYDRIEIRKAKSINEITKAPIDTIWQKHSSGVMGAHIWAPELHKINGKWYIYFAAGEAKKVWNIRIWVLSNNSADPTKGEWKEEGQLKTSKESFSLDATTFEHNGTQYLIWAQHVREGENTSLLISKMESPTKLTGKEVVISDPDLPWEKIGYNVNEGPGVLIKKGKVFVTYSASATDHNYCMGLLWADKNADLLNAESWHKLQQPVFATNDSLKRYGPGHSCFTISENGKYDILIYHARDYKKLQGSPLSDPNRHTRARIINWTKEGFPDFGQNIAD